MNTQSKFLKEEYRGCTIYAYGELADDKDNIVVNRQHTNPTNDELEYIEASYGKKFSCGAVTSFPGKYDITDADAIKACKRRFSEQTIKSSHAAFLTMPLVESILRYLIEIEKKYIDCHNPVEKQEDNTQTCGCSTKVCQCQEKGDVNNVSSPDFRDKYVRIEFLDGSWAIAYNCQRNDVSNMWDVDWVKWLNDNSVTIRSPYSFYNNQIVEMREATEDEVNLMKDTDCKVKENVKKLDEASKKMFDFDNLSLFPFWGW